MQSFHIYLYGPDCGPINTTFEATALRLEQLPRLCFEPDGSFVWTQFGGEEQIFGMLYDANDSLQYVELRGQCLHETWQRLITAIKGKCSHDLAVLCLPERQLQDLQGFEKAAFC